jgi:hypothetical protein
MADGAVPPGPQGGHDRVQKHLDGVVALSGIGEVAQSQSAMKLVGSEMVGMRHEEVSERIAGG